MPSVEFIKKVRQAELCVGCGACAAIAPQSLTMETSEDGFLRPKVIGKMSKGQRAQVMQICPGVQQSASAVSSQYHPLWGTFETVLEGWALDPDLRHAGASGGALSATLAWLLETEQVDGVLSTMADTNAPLGNETVITKHHDQIVAQAASRYAPSKPLDQVPALLEEGGCYAFVGKPCDVEALRNWARLDPRIDQRFPVKLSFFCAGVPSVYGAEAVSRKLGVAPEDVQSFRYRGNGWPGAATVKSKSGQEASMSYHDSWGGVLSKHVQSRCRICVDGIGLAADVVFADAWKTDNQGYPLFEEQDGRSLIIARNAVGDDLIKRAVQDGAIDAVTSSINQIAPMQPGQVRRRRELLGRLIGRVLAGQPLPRYRNLAIWRNGRDLGVRAGVRVALGMMRRCLQRRAAKT